MRKILLGAGLAGALLCGCVTVQNKPLTANASAQLEGKSLTYAVHSKPDFAAMTAGKAMFAVFGAAAMVSKGNSIIAENNVPDPAQAISSGLMQRLADQRHMSVQDTPIRAASDKLDALAAQGTTADYLLDVQTINWMYGYYPSKPSYYRVLYSARMRLIDTHTKKVVAETLCKAQPNTDENAPTQDELLNDHAAGLKHLLDKAATDCTDVLSKQILHV